MIENIKENKWKIVAIIAAIAAILIYLYPKNDNIELSSEEAADDKVVDFEKKEEK